MKKMWLGILTLLLSGSIGEFLIMFAWQNASRKRHMNDSWFLLLLSVILPIALYVVYYLVYKGKQTKLGDNYLSFGRMLPWFVGSIALFCGGTIGITLGVLGKKDILVSWPALLIALVLSVAGSFVSYRFFIPNIGWKK